MHALAVFALLASCGASAQGTPDAFEITQRFAAAANLGRVGLKDDARAQFNWLYKNVKDPEQLELIRRAMQKL